MNLRNQMNWVFIALVMILLFGCPGQKKGQRDASRLQDMSGQKVKPLRLPDITSEKKAEDMPSPIDSSTAESEKVPEGPGPVVHIDSPDAGWSGTRIVHVSGTVSDTTITRGTLVLNGTPKGLTISGGQFSTDLIMSPGSNTVQVVVKDSAGRTGMDIISLFSQVPPKDMKILLTWDTDGTDIDMHVVDPNGEECYYGTRNTKIGGQLDQDVTTGFGPETFTLSNAVNGTYEVRAKYYSDNGNPQTFVRVDVILYEGTDKEERLTFSGVLQKTDEVVHIATFTLPR